MAIRLDSTDSRPVIRQEGPLAGRVILVTGAARGIGLRTCLELVRQGAQVVALGRQASFEHLWATGVTLPGEICVEFLDVRVPAQIDAAVARVVRRFGHIDALINNAAVNYRALVMDMGEEDIRDQLETNFLGPLHLIRAVLPHMRRERNGRIVNISSVGGMMAMPSMGMYSATKFALEGLSEALWYECRRKGIWVSLVEPGFIDSGALDHVRLSAAARERIYTRDEDAAFYPAFESFVRRLYRWFGSPESMVVGTIVRALSDRRPSLRYPATPDALFFFWMRRLLPRSVYHSLLLHNIPSLSAPKPALVRRPAFR